MEFCRYYGMSVPQLLLLNNLSDVPELAGYLNNPLDFEKLQDFKKEIEFFVDFFQQAQPRMPISKSRLKTDIDYTRWDLYEKHNDIRYRRKGYKLSPEELEIINNVLRYKNISYFNTVYIDWRNEAIKLSEEEEAAICSYFRTKLEVVPKLLEKLNFTESKESTVFNMTVMSIVSNNADRLLSVFSTKFKDPKEKFSDAVYDEYDKNLALLESLIQEPGTKSQKKSSAKPDVEFTSIQQRDDMLSARDKNVSLRKNPAGFNKLCELYDLLNNIDADTYNSAFGLNLTREEYEVIFDHLADLGLVGLNFCALDFFKEFINTISFSSEDKIVIQPDSLCAQNLNLLRRFLDTIRTKVGDEIE